MFDPALLPPELAAAGDVLAARIEEAGLNAAQPSEQLLYDGWLLRHSPGKARRARSVNAIADGRQGLQAKIDHCRAFYAQAGLCPACSESRRSVGRRDSMTPLPGRVSPRTRKRV
jgi:hypothetical protein